jgi:hypothetical protein
MESPLVNVLYHPKIVLKWRQRLLNKSEPKQWVLRLVRRKGVSIKNRNFVRNRLLQLVEIVAGYVE